MLGEAVGYCPPASDHSRIENISSVVTARERGQGEEKDQRHEGKAFKLQLCLPAATTTAAGAAWFRFLLKSLEEQVKKSTSCHKRIENWNWGLDVINVATVSNLTWLKWNALWAVGLTNTSAFPFQWKPKNIGNSELYIFTYVVKNEETQGFGWWRTSYENSGSNNCKGHGKRLPWGVCHAVSLEALSFGNWRSSTCSRTIQEGPPQQS